MPKTSPKLRAAEETGLSTETRAPGWRDRGTGRLGGERRVEPRAPCLLRMRALGGSRGGGDGGVLSRWGGGRGGWRRGGEVGEERRAHARGRGLWEGPQDPGALRSAPE